MNQNSKAAFLRLVTVTLIPRVQINTKRLISNNNLKFVIEKKKLNSYAFPPVLMLILSMFLWIAWSMATTFPKQRGDGVSEGVFTVLSSSLGRSILMVGVPCSSVSESALRSCYEPSYHSHSPSATA